MKLAREKKITTLSIDANIYFDNVSNFTLNYQ